MRWEGGGVRRPRHDPMAIIGEPFELKGLIIFNPTNLTNFYHQSKFIVDYVSIQIIDWKIRENLEFVMYVLVFHDEQLK